MRVSKICTDEQIASERQREYFRDRRWARRRSMVSVVGRWLVVMALAMGIDLRAVENALSYLLAIL